MTARSKVSLTFAAVALLAAPALAADARPNAEFARKASWKLPAAVEVREASLAWLADRDVDDATRAQLDTLWSSATSDENSAHLLDTLAVTLAAGDPRAKPLVEFCSRPQEGVALPDVAWLADENTQPLERANLRLLFGQWLVQQSLVDEAAGQLKDLKPEDVVDPAALLFYQAVLHHEALEREGGLAAIGRLLEQEPRLPKRYVSLARLMQADLEGLKDESLDHISRRMGDIRRRLDLGRAGPKVREVEDGVIASLDKLIEELEKQQQAAASAAAASGRGTLRPSQPAPDSMPMGGKGPGDVAKKPIGNESGWGDLPPRQRHEALQQIGKDFPAHYRDVIEQYFRKLASDSEQPEGK